MNKNLKNKLLVSIYIILMAIAFTTRYGDHKLGITLQLSIGFIIIISAFIYRWNSHKKFDINIKFFTKTYFIPLIIIHLYSIILTTLGFMNKSYLSTNATVYIPVLLVISSFYLFEDKTFKYNFYALILSWFLSVSYSLITKGIYIFPHAIMQGYINPYDTTGGLTVNYLELHDLVLSLGYVVIYYLYNTKKIIKKDLPVILLTILIILLGIKRISILGIIVSVIFMKFSQKLSTNNQKKSIKIIGTLIFIAAYIFIYCISLGDSFFELLDKFNINLMGRNYYYQEIMKYGKFSIYFIGLGRNAVTNLMTGPLSYLKVGAAHSDILKMYIENGFIVFGLWLWYYLIKIPKEYLKKYNLKVCLLYATVMIYTFTLYFTDNTENYFMCQIFSIIILMDYILKNKKTQKEKLGDKNVQ